jgi:hypothetical protein
MNTPNKYEQALKVIKARGIQTLPQHKVDQLSILAAECPDLTPIDLANEVTQASDERLNRAATATRKKLSTLLAKASEALA